MKRAVMVVALAVISCSKGNAEDMRNICDAEALAKIPPGASPSEKATLIAGFIQKNAPSAKTKKLFQKLAGAAPSEKGALLREAAAHEGVSPCALADETDAEMKAHAPH